MATKSVTKTFCFKKVASLFFIFLISASVFTAKANDDYSPAQMVVAAVKIITNWRAISFSLGQCERIDPANAKYYNNASNRLIVEYGDSAQLAYDVILHGLTQEGMSEKDAFKLIDDIWTQHADALVSRITSGCTAMIGSYESRTFPFDFDDRYSKELIELRKYLVKARR